MGGNNTARRKGALYGILGKVICLYDIRPGDCNRACQSTLCLPLFMEE
jgi:hypothetical protein